LSGFGKEFIFERSCSPGISRRFRPTGGSEIGSGEGPAEESPPAGRLTDETNYFLFADQLSRIDRSGAPTNSEIQLLRESWTFKWVMVALAITAHPRRDGVLCCHKIVREDQGRPIG
jgi:hypothetical protein